MNTASTATRNRTEAPGATVGRRAGPTFPLGSAIWAALPGIIGVIVLAALFIALQGRAQKQIAYISPRGDLRLMQADGSAGFVISATAIFSTAGYQIDSVAWSPNGARLAVAGGNRDNATVAIVDPLSNRRGPFVPLATTSAGFAWRLIDRPWSADGQSVALVGRLTLSPEAPADIAIRRLSDGVAATWPNFRLDPSAPPAWNPAAAALLVSGRRPTDTLNTIYILRLDKEVAPFAPADGQASRWGATWSHSGTSVAYVAREDGAQIQSGGSQALSGTIWIAASNTSAPKRLVTGEPGYGPQYSADDKLVFYSRFVTATQTIDLFAYSLAADNSYRVGTLARGGGAQTPFVPALIWSPGKDRLAYTGIDQQGRMLVYLTNATGTESPGIAYTEPSPGAMLTVEWMANGRGLLIGSPSQGVIRRWLIGETRVDVMAEGTEPAQQP